MYSSYARRYAKLSDHLRSQYSINLSFFPTSRLLCSLSLGLSAPSSLALSACNSMPASKKPSASKVSTKQQPRG